jgi:hypothetical protein
MVLGIILCVVGPLQFVFAEGGWAAFLRLLAAVAVGGVLIYFGRRALDPWEVFARRHSTKPSFWRDLKRRFAPKCANCGTVLDTSRYAHGVFMPSALEDTAYKCRACGTRCCYDCANKVPCKTCHGRVFDVAVG